MNFSEWCNIFTHHSLHYPSMILKTCSTGKDIIIKTWISYRQHVIYYRPIIQCHIIDKFSWFHNCHSNSFSNHPLNQRTHKVMSKNSLQTIINMLLIVLHHWKLISYTVHAECKLHNTIRAASNFAIYIINSTLNTFLMNPSSLYPFCSISHVDIFLVCS